MSIPDYQTIMLPLLRFASDGQEHSVREAIDVLAKQFSLSVDERDQLLPSGQQAIFDNRVNWAVTYMKKAGLLEPTRRAHFRVTPRGGDVVRSNPPRIDGKFLEQFAEFQQFKTKRNIASVATPAPKVLAPQEDDETPEEAIEGAYQRLRSALAAELLDQVMACSPAFFERLVIDVLVTMGYGGTRRDAGEAIGRSGDAGIDGIIKEDRLGLDVIYIQAKRWDGAVGRPEIQKFVGALQGQRARKGIFITTSSFTKEALQYASMIDTKVVLIDGDLLAQLMIDHGVGVAPMATYELKRVDSDYFTSG
jgi:restriction system protein